MDPNIPYITSVMCHNKSVSYWPVNKQVTQKLCTTFYNITTSNIKRKAKEKDSRKYESGKYKKNIKNEEKTHKDQSQRLK